MSAVVRFPRYGGPEVLEVDDVEPPEVAPDRLRVRVKAAGVNPFDCKYRAGGYDGQVPAHFPQRLGNDFAGVVEEVGAEVTGWTEGDEVLGFTGRAAYAEHVVARPARVVRKPAELSWEVAGGLSTAAQTAYEGVVERLAVGAGDTLLVHAAAGGVGGVAVQLARHAGATVVGTASEHNHAYVRELGAIPVRYGPGLADRVRAMAPAGVTRVFDAAGRGAVETSLELVRDRSAIVTIAAGDVAERYGVQTFSMKPDATRLATLADLAARGELRVPIWRAVPLADVRQAHAESERGHARGKIVLLVN